MSHAFDHNAFDLNAFDVDVVSATAVISDGVVIVVSVGNATASGTRQTGSAGGRRPGRFVYPQLPRILEPVAFHAIAKIERGVTIKVSVGPASASGTATATPNGITIYINLGEGVSARGIQNPTDEQLLELLDAA